jgi:hypothetical protein
MELHVQPTDNGFVVNLGPAYWAGDHWSLDSAKAKVYSTFNAAFRAMMQFELSETRARAIQLRATRAAFAVVGHGLHPEDTLINDATVVILVQAHPQWRALRAREADSLAKGFREFANSESFVDSDLEAIASRFVREVMDAYGAIARPIATPREALLVLAKSVAELSKPISSRLWDRMADLGLLKGRGSADDDRSSSHSAAVYEVTLAEARNNLSANNKSAAKSQLEFAASISA